MGNISYRVLEFDTEQITEEVAMAQKRRTITGSTVRYPMIIESELYDKLRRLSKGNEISIAALVSDAIKQYLDGDRKDREIQRLVDERNLLRGQLGNSGKSKELAVALSESIETRTHLENQLREAKERLSDVTGKLSEIASM